MRDTLRAVRNVPWIALLLLARGAAASEVGCPAQIDVTSATGSYYTPTAEGHCSLPVAPNEFIAAIATDGYGDSSPCGRCARVTGPLGSVTVRIVDECEPCVGNDLDLSPETFDEIGVRDDGLIPIAWRTVACPVGESTMKLQFEASNHFYLKVQVQNHRHGVAAVAMKDGATWVPMERTPDNHFERTAGGSFEDPFVFRITAVHGERVETGGILLVDDVPQDTGVQFAPCPEPERSAGTIALAALAALVRRRGAQSGVACTTASSSAP